MQSGKGGNGSAPAWSAAAAAQVKTSGTPVSAWSNNPWAGAAGDASQQWAQYYNYYAQQQQVGGKLPAPPPGQPPQWPPNKPAASQTPTASSSIGGASNPQQWAAANAYRPQQPPAKVAAASSSSSAWTGSSAAYGSQYQQPQQQQSHYGAYPAYAAAASGVASSRGSASSTGNYAYNGHAGEPAAKKQKVAEISTPFASSANPYNPLAASRPAPYAQVPPQQPQQYQQRSTPAQQQQQQQTPNANEWPPSLKRYVERSFAQYTGEQQRSMMEEKLRNIIKGAIESNSLFKRDWDRVPLPQLDPPAPVAYAKASAAYKAAPQPSTPAPIAASKKSAKGSDPFRNVGAPDAATRKAEERKARFSRDAEFQRPMYQDITQLLANSQTPTGEVDWDSLRITGTGTFLEKSYLRLTSIPDPSSVRSEAVLKKAVEFVKQKWKQGSPWNYVTDQFKSIRQDLTVQGIYNEFTVQVYETHARLCLENGDIGEYNQCQGQLKDLFRLGISGHVLEFTAYRLMYYLYNEDLGGLTHLLAELTPEMMKSVELTHALQVITAVTTENYHRFFKLYQKAPNMGQYIMDNLFERIRFSALKTMAKSYRPEKLPVDFLQQELQFPSAQEAADFILAHGGLMESNNTEFNTKESVAGFKNYEDNLVIAK